MDRFGLAKVQQHNAETMELDIGQARAIATVKLDDEQCLGYLQRPFGAEIE